MYISLVYKSENWQRSQDKSDKVQRWLKTSRNILVTFVVLETRVQLLTTYIHTKGPELFQSKRGHRQQTWFCYYYSLRKHRLRSMSPRCHKEDLSFVSTLSWVSSYASHGLQQDVCMDSWKWELLYKMSRNYYSLKTGKSSKNLTVTRQCLAFLLDNWLMDWFSKLRKSSFDQRTDKIFLHQL